MKIKKLADKSVERIVRFDVATGRRKLIDPETGNESPRTLVGVMLLDYGERETISTKLVQQGIAEGWIEGRGEEVRHAPAGPPAQPWKRTHTFVCYQQLVFRTVEGDVVFDVVKNPCKKPDGDRDRIDWAYDLELADVREPQIAVAT